MISAFFSLRKLCNFVRSKYHPENISKSEGKRADFQKSFKNFKIVDGHLICKGEKRMIFDNHRNLLIPHYFTLIQYSFVTLELQTK